jgi:hypothetical protein
MKMMASKRMFFLSVVGFVLTLSHHNVRASPAKNSFLSFDIPAQSLARAIDAYVSITGRDVLVDREALRGLRSSAVRGALSADEALSIMISATELKVLKRGRDGFALVPSPSSSVGPEEKPAQNQSTGPAWPAYFSEVQKALALALCRDDRVRPGTYAVGLQIWISSGGAVRTTHLAGSTGDQRRDDRLVLAVSKVRFPPPPSDLPQPVSILMREGVRIANETCLADPRTIR